MTMEVARANCPPFTVDDHEFGMNPNRLALSVVPQSSDAGQREIFEGSQGRQFLCDFSFGRHHRHNLDAPQQSLA